MQVKQLSEVKTDQQQAAVIGVCATCDPRIDNQSRTRAKNIIKLVAEKLAAFVHYPDGKPVPIVFSDTLIDGEKQADQVARQFKQAGVNILICVPDTWAFPQLTILSLLSHFPKETPLNFTCGNSGPRPGVVFTHAVSGAVAQQGRLMHINVGNWDDTGLEPNIRTNTINSLVDWAYAAVTYQALKGKRVVIFGHDSMGMETALTHVLPTRETFGLEITRLDMKLPADMLMKKSYDQNELKALRNWLDTYVGDRIEIETEEQNDKFNQSLAMYLIVRDLMQDLNAVGGGFMSQLEWGSDLRGLPLPVADVMESLFNSTFDHNGEKPVMPFATEADTQALLTMLFTTWLSGGNPPLFMDFRKVWEPWEIKQLADSKNLKLPGKHDWETRGLVDGNNSGSASFDWAAKPGTPLKQIMQNIRFPLANHEYFPGGGNSVSFISPGGIPGIAARLAYSNLSGMFSLVWDEAETVEVPIDLATLLSNSTDPTWPHTFLTPKHATMTEYKQYAPANHLHMTWDLNTPRLQYWTDLTNVFSATPWEAMPDFREGIDRPLPLLYVINGGETQAKLLRTRKP
ncbi:MAG: hypothetical protein GF313_04545 [Caldithrix sp.]|nr:hypothetical protein [Caldithrix sp.]